MEKLKSILRNQRFRSACSFFFVFLILARFMIGGSLVWGAVFLVAACFLYFRRTANMLAALPLFTGVVISPFFFPYYLPAPFTVLFAASVTVLLYMAQGVKDLFLIRREMVIDVGAYALAYIALLLFFMQAVSAAFLIVWLYAVFCVWLAFVLITRDRRIALLLTTLMGELAWIISWLPIGFLNAASMCFACVLFMGDVVRENRVSRKNTLIIAGITVFIASTSYWQI